MMKRKLLWCLSFSLLVIFACAYTPTTDPMQMSQEEKLAFAWGIYKAQYKDYMSMAAMPNLSEDVKVVLREKKKVLTASYNTIMTYRGFVAAGKAPPEETEQALFDFINQYAY